MTKPITRLATKAKKDKVENNSTPSKSSSFSGKSVDPTVHSNDESANVNHLEPKKVVTDRRQDTANVKQAPREAKTKRDFATAFYDNEVMRYKYDLKRLKLDEERLAVERERLEMERQKMENDFAMERERMDMERQRMKNDFQLRRLELRVKFIADLIAAGKHDDYVQHVLDRFFSDTPL